MSGAGCKICTGPTFDPEVHDLIFAIKMKATDLENIWEDDAFKNTAGQVYYKEYMDIHARVQTGHETLETEPEPKTSMKTQDGKWI